MIRLEQINRSFEVGDETVHALRDVTLDLATGDYISIMGPSGSGKSTLLNILGLLDQPDSGHYFLDETDTTTLNETDQAVARRDHIGFVFQSFHLIPRLNAAQNVELPLILAGIEPGERAERVAKALELMGLSDRAKHRPDQLSGGQRQRVAIARATIMQPALLLADEPTGNLDKHSGDEVIQTLEALNQQGITLVVVTHDPEIGSRASRTIRMVDGAIVGEIPRSSPGGTTP
ncbi:ABC transporter ATP-binding protein [Sedimenticola selenatireducens]|uniref:ABC transporter ATP-binding protein n=1 Tax=Sedimenticola selenatireducens TaxID=191960 RepID=A0A557SEP1_9GAMM|nr:ABC transporter ATP-binding protein [Sedimenticola selenatireducens]TVO75812.1 ABC transporter ATP-binding protein [Sedimenticola selenatireducens]TVT63671.1 MAG: ABC transporter ATP-binding protein [Sedimenticola selenatireducens]